MSDRHIVQKNFNLMLEECRCKILPDVIEWWENLAEAEQERIQKINFESTPNENSFIESNFGCLDRLMREKPNANEITLESIYYVQFE